MSRDRQAPEKQTDKLASKVAKLRQSLKGTRPEEIAFRSGVVVQDDHIHLDMLFRPYVINITDYCVSQPGGKDVSSFHQSLILTYLQTADGVPSADRWVSFRELPNGAFYHQAFQGYAPDRLTKHWGLDVDGFVDACGALGGIRLDMADAGFMLRVLPRIDLAAVYWLGDEDLPSRASILFDANAHHYMITDGLAILGSHLVDKVLAAGGSEDK